MPVEAETTGDAKHVLICLCWLLGSSFHHPSLRIHLVNQLKLSYTLVKVNPMLRTSAFHLVYECF